MGYDGFKTAKICLEEFAVYTTNTIREHLSFNNPANNVEGEVIQDSRTE